MSLALRLAREADLDALVLIERSHPSCPGWSREQFAEELARGVVLVAELDGEVAAFGCYRRVLEEAQIMDLAVHPDRLRQGLGAALARGLLERARSEGLVKATLEVEEGNAPAVSLYMRLGFCVVGRRANFYNTGRDALLMELAL